MSGSLLTMWERFLLWAQDFAPKLLAAGLILLIGWWLSAALGRLLARAMTRTKADAGILSFIGSLATAFVKVIVCITAAAQLGMNVTSLIAALGAAGVTAGLALKDSLANVASGAQIIFTRPFRVGDYLSLDGVEGTVERIEILFTTLRTFDNKQIVIPNAKVTVSVITNYSAMESRRLDLTFSVGGSSDVAGAKTLLTTLAENEPMVLKEPAPLIAVSGYKDGGVTLTVNLWCKNDDYLPLLYKMQEEGGLALEQAGFRLTAPRTDVHLR